MSLTKEEKAWKRELNIGIQKASSAHYQKCLDILDEVFDTLESRRKEIEVLSCELEGRK